MQKVNMNRQVRWFDNKIKEMEKELEELKKKEEKAVNEYGLRKAVYQNESKFSKKDWNSSEILN